MQVYTIYILAVIILLAQTKLIYLTELFRHGARYPVSDIYDGKDTKPFHGQLTSIGMRQQYLLGSYLKKDYLNELKLTYSTFNPRQVEIFSDGSQRCYQSAYAHAAGMFSLDEGVKIPQGIDSSLLNPPFDQSSNLLEQPENDQFSLNRGYQPIPIRSGQAYFPSCANEPKLIAKRIEAIAVQAAQIQAEQAPFTQKMRVVFNLSIQYANIGGLVELYDTVVCDLNLGRPMPVQFTDRDFLQLKYIQNYMFILLYAENLAHIVSTPIASSIIDKMEKVIAGKYDDKKLTIYSGHDTNVAPMLSFFNLSSADCVRRKYKNQTVVGNCAEPVPFASNIIWQLHLNQNLVQQKEDELKASNYFVKIKYNGEYYQLCQKKSIECEFEQFKNRVKHQLVDYQKQCGSK